MGLKDKLEQQAQKVAEEEEALRKEREEQERYGPIRQAIAKVQEQRSKLESMLSQLEVYGAATSQARSERKLGFSELSQFYSQYEAVIHQATGGRVDSFARFIEDPEYAGEEEVQAYTDKKTNLKATLRTHKAVKQQLAHEIVHEEESAFTPAQQVAREAKLAAKTRELITAAEQKVTELTEQIQSLEEQTPEGKEAIEAKLIGEFKDKLAREQRGINERIPKLLLVYESDILAAEKLGDDKVKEILLRHYKEGLEGWKKEKLRHYTVGGESRDLAMVKKELEVLENQRAREQEVYMALNQVQREFSQTRDLLINKFEENPEGYQQLQYDGLVGDNKTEIAERYIGGFFDGKRLKVSALLERYQKFNKTITGVVDFGDVGNLVDKHDLDRYTSNDRIIQTKLLDADNLIEVANQTAEALRSIRAFVEKQSGKRLTTWDTKEREQIVPAKDYRERFVQMNAGAIKCVSELGYQRTKNELRGAEEQCDQRIRELEPVLKAKLDLDWCMEKLNLLRKKHSDWHEVLRLAEKHTEDLKAAEHITELITRVGLESANFRHITFEVGLDVNRSKERPYTVEFVNLFNENSKYREQNIVPLEKKMLQKQQELRGLEAKGPGIFNKGKWERQKRELNDEIRELTLRKVEAEQKINNDRTFIKKIFPLLEHLLKFGNVGSNFVGKSCTCQELLTATQEALQSIQTNPLNLEQQQFYEEYHRLEEESRIREKQFGSYKFA